MIGEVAYVVGMREVYVKRNCQIAFVVIFLIGVMIAVAIVADIRTGSNPS